MWFREKRKYFLENLECYNFFRLIRCFPNIQIRGFKYTEIKIYWVIVYERKYDDPLQKVHLVSEMKLHDFSVWSKRIFRLKNCIIRS